MELLKTKSIRAKLALCWLLCSSCSVLASVIYFAWIMLLLEKQNFCAFME